MPKTVIKKSVKTTAQVKSERVHVKAPRPYLLPGILDWQPSRKLKLQPCENPAGSSAGRQQERKMVSILCCFYGVTSCSNQARALSQSTAAWDT